ncbi:hypothetical protein CaCOL14_003301 [Colletotrichum acutatum]
MTSWASRQGMKNEEMKTDDGGRIITPSLNLNGNLPFQNVPETPERRPTKSQSSSRNRTWRSSNHHRMSPNYAWQKTAPSPGQ